MAAVWASFAILAGCGLFKPFDRDGWSACYATVPDAETACTGVCDADFSTCSESCTDSGCASDCERARITCDHACIDDSTAAYRQCDVDFETPDEEGSVAARDCRLNNNQGWLEGDLACHEEAVSCFNGCENLVCWTSCYDSTLACVGLTYLLDSLALEHCNKNYVEGVMGE